MWDVVVIGAGPAGALAARQLALRGLSVLLVDKARFPRQKVCGCCVNRAALSTLEAVGLGELPHTLGGNSIRAFRLHTPRRQVSLPIHEGVSVSRAAFDQALVDRAVEAGAVFRDSVSAALEEEDASWRYVQLNGDIQVRARLVLAADGVGSAGADVASHNRIGVAATISSPLPLGEGRVRAERRNTRNEIIRVNTRRAFGPHPNPLPRGEGVIDMAYHRCGYVGMVQLEDGRLNIAAALDPVFCKKHGGPAGAISDILRESHVPVPVDFDALVWHGTPLLTRRYRQLGAHRLFRIGDAAGYVEPFTGEGIAWALMSAQAIAPFAVEAIHRWHTTLIDEWTATHRRLIGRRQRFCRLVRRGLRHPLLVETIAASLVVAPRLAAPFLRNLERPGAVQWA